MTVSDTDGLGGTTLQTGRASLAFCNVKRNRMLVFHRDPPCRYVIDRCAGADESYNIIEDNLIKAQPSL